MSHLLCAFRKERPEIEPGNPAQGVVQFKEKRKSLNAPLMQRFLDPGAVGNNQCRVNRAAIPVDDRETLRALIKEPRLELCPEAG